MPSGVVPYAPGVDIRWRGIEGSRRQRLGAMEPNYSVRRVDGRVAVTGEIDLSSALRFTDDVLAAADDTGGTLQLDLSGVTFIDSSGLQALITVVQAVRRPVHIGASSRVFVALDVVGLTDGKWNGVTVQRIDD
jgi:anti-anti-sigma factor